jgi:hypothetical protein
MNRHTEGCLQPKSEVAPVLCATKLVVSVNGWSRWLKERVSGIAE